MASPKRKTTNPGTSDAEDLNLHDVPIGQSPPTEPTPAQLAKQEKRAEAQRALQAKKATVTNKKAAAMSQAEKEAAAAATAEAKTQNNLSQHEDNQPEQILHDELNLELRAPEMKKSHMANQLATKKRAAEQA